MKKFLLIILFCSSSYLWAQNNMIPNPGFEICSATGCLAGQFFNTQLANWRMYDPCNNNISCGAWKKSKTHWILNSCSPPVIYMKHSRNCNSGGQDRFILLNTRIYKEAAIELGDSYTCSRIGKDNIAVALPNGATFTVGKRFKIRYKIVAMPGLCGSENITYAECEEKVVHAGGCLSRITAAKLRIFASEKGPNNWLDNNNYMEELSSANFTNFNPTQTGCDWRLIEREFTVNKSGLTTLGFVTHSGSFLLDDVEVFPICDENYLIQNKLYNSPIYNTNAIEGSSLIEWAGNNLTAGSNVGLNNGIGPVEIKNLSNITYKAGGQITLKDDFWAHKGSEFRAAIEECPVEGFRPPNDTGLVGERFPELGWEEEPDPLERNMGATGIGNLKNHNNLLLNAYPNPVTNKLKIQSSLLTQEANVRITNCINQVVGEYTSNKGLETFEVDFSGFANGIYFITVYDVNGTIQGTTKIVKPE